MSAMHLFDYADSLDRFAAHILACAAERRYRMMQSDNPYAAEVDADRFTEDLDDAIGLQSDARDARATVRDLYERMRA